MTESNHTRLVGMKFGNLLVLKKVKPANGTHAAFICSCKCGSELVVRGHNLRKGQKSCNKCATKDRTITHGLSKTIEYTTWAGIIQRCEDKKNKSFMDYGSRGVAVCKRWRKSFFLFLKDMGLRPSKFHTIERRDNDGDYMPSNCYWATRKQQAKNRRTNVVVEYLGQKRILKEWAEIFKINYSMLYFRYKKGWPIDIMLTKKSRKS